MLILKNKGRSVARCPEPHFVNPCYIIIILQPKAQNWFFTASVLRQELRQDRMISMKKTATERLKRRADIFGEIKLYIILIIIGATLGGLYASPWPTYFKIIIFGFLFLLFQILNELSRIANLNDKSIETSILTFFQLNLMGKKQGIKENQADLKRAELQESVAQDLIIKRMLFGDNESLFIIFALFLLGISATITVFLIT